MYEQHSNKNPYIVPAQVFATTFLFYEVDNLIKM